MSMVSVKKSIFRVAFWALSPYLGVVFIFGMTACKPGTTPERTRARWHNNQGVVYMDQHNYVRGREHFEDAKSLDPSYGLAWANFGIAMFSLGKYDTALVALDKALYQNPNLLQAHYTRGLIFHAQGKEHESALASFKTVVESDDDDPLAHYYLGRTLAKLQRDEEAISEFRRAIELDPNNVSAHYALSHQLRLIGQTEEWHKTLQKFDELSRAGFEGVSSSYQGQGKYAEAITDGSYADKNHGDDITAAIEFELSQKFELAQNLHCVNAILGKDGLDLVITTSDGTRLWTNEGMGFKPSDRWTFHTNSTPVNDLVFGNLDNDEDQDMVMSSVDNSFCILNEEDEFKTISNLGTGSARSVLADVDHDGDLDVLCVGNNEHRLWSNDGSASFSDITQQAGIKSSIGSRAIFADFDNDRDIDFMVLGKSDKIELYENNRDGTFSDRADERGLNNRANKITLVDFSIGDFNPDGRMDISAITRKGQLLTYVNTQDATGSHVFRESNKLKLPFDSAQGIHTADFDNDGDLDLVTYGSGAIHFLQKNDNNFALSNFSIDNTQDSARILLEDFDNDGDIDLWRTGQLHSNITAGGKWIQINLKGLNSNPDGAGAKVEVKTTHYQQKRELRRSSSSPSLLTFGLGEVDSVEFVRILWPSGVRQTELATGAMQRLELTELNRKGTSCPILYAWDGHNYRFVTDFLGGGIIGYLTSPGTYYKPDHDEYIRIESLKPKNGRYVLQVINQLEEIIYLDATQLIAVDHPPEFEIHPNERLLSAPPYPEFEPCALTELRAPLTAIDHRGNNIMDQLADIDNNWYDDFEHNRIHGYTDEYSLTLDLGDLSSMNRPALLIHGWVDYAHSTSNWAAAQAQQQLHSPKLEIPDGAGGWEIAIADMGVPAGLPKYMLVDLSNSLPAGTQIVRISMKSAVYFDQILIGDIMPRNKIDVHRRDITRAHLHWRGYPEHTPINNTFAYIYDYDRINPYNDWGSHAGSFTRLGEVTKLLGKVDDQFVIMFHGDELTMEIPQGAFPKLTEGLERTFLFYADGFGKDMDFHSAASLSVEPLPFHGMSTYPYPVTESYPHTPSNTEYILEYNTRRIAGKYD